MSYGLIFFVKIIRYKRFNIGAKKVIYECGVDPETPDARETYSIRFYLLALVFIVFEIETIFLFPWAVIYDKLLIFGFIEMAIFIVILFLGYIYAWRMGALDFRKGIK